MRCTGVITEGSEKAFTARNRGFEEKQARDSYPGEIVSCILKNNNILLLFYEACI